MSRSALPLGGSSSPRFWQLAVGTAGFVLGAGLAMAGQVAAASPAMSPAVSPAVSPADAATQCPPDEQEAGPAGTPGIGTLGSKLPEGRVLMTVGSLVGPSGIFAVAVIDDIGVHEIDTSPDFTMNGAQWETQSTAVFDSERAGQRHLFRLHLVDGSIEQLTSGPSEAQGSVSVLADGRLVHESSSCVTGLSLGIHVTSSDGTQTSAITDPQASAEASDDEQPDGSPDGRSVVFVRQSRDDTGAIFVVSADGGTPTRLTEDIAGIGRPRWSPDGRTILFGKSGSLWTVPSTGGDPQQIPHCPAYCWEGDWSPDGTHLIFKVFAYGADHVEVWTANADGSDPQALWVGDHSSAEQPHWGE